MSTPDDLREVAHRLHQLTARRDALVRQRIKEGAPLRTIAEEAGLSHAGVARIRDRGTDT